MFMLVDGRATVVEERDGGPTPVAFLRSGVCLGEMSLLTGERRSATVIAQTDCDVVEIGKAVLAKSLKTSLALLPQLGELQAGRQFEIEGILAAETKGSVAEAQQTKYTASFVDKLRTFFEL